MDIAPRTGRTRRRMLASLTLAAVATAMLSTVSTTAHANPFCLVKNETTSVQGSDLQQAIDDATSGDTIDVSGICFGSFRWDTKNLTFRGIPTPARKNPALDGTNNGGDSVLRFSTAHVQITDLLIMHGSFSGISATEAQLTLNGSTRVVHNTNVSQGGGIKLRGGSSLTLNDSARVKLNSAPQGAGVYIDDGNMTMNGTSRVNRNNASGSPGLGGGVYVQFGSVTMNGSATIIGNTAGVEGGGIYLVSSFTVGATAGGNVRHNHPDNIFVAP